MIETLNGVADGWWQWMAPMAWQVALLAAVVWLIDLGLRRRGWPQVRYALWGLIFVKLLIPPTFGLPSSLFSHLAPAEGQAARAVAIREAGPVETADFGPVPRAGSTAVPASELRAAATPAQAAPPEGSSLSWKGWGMLGSGAVSFLLLGWLIGGVFRLRRLVRADGTKQAPDWVMDTLARAARRVRLRRMPRVVVSEGVKSAAVFGIFRPVLLLPEGVCEETSPRQMEHIMLHELAHLKRGDLLMNAAQTLVQTAFWFHPVVWLAGRKLRHLRELCCDSSVSRLLRERTPEYRETLVEAARSMIFGSGRPGLGLLGLFESASRLRQRLEHLERPAWKHGRLKAIASLAAAAVMLACIVPMARVAAEGKPTEKAEAFAATLPEAVTVELVGVSYHPSKGKQWWRPDGAPLEDPPYSEFGTTSRLSPPPNREFALRVRPSHADARCHISGAGGSLSGTPLGKEGRPVPDLRVKAAHFSSAEGVCSVRVSVATGEWHTLAETDGSGAAGIGTHAGGMAFGRAEDHDAGCAITVSHDVEDRTVRIVAVTVDGQVHLPTRGTMVGGGNVSQTTVVFAGVPRDQVSEFRFQVRPFQWVEFRNVSLEPGRKTDVDVVVNPETREGGQPEAGVGPAAETPAAPAVQGKVTRASDGRPVGGVRVELWTGDFGTAAEAVSDESGAFEIATDRTGAFVLVARSEDWFSRFGEVPYRQVKLAEGQTIRADIEVVPAGAFAGTVTDRSRGEPLEGMEVSLLRGLLKTTTGRDGAFRLAGLPPGLDVPLRVTGPGYGIEALQVNATSGGEVTRRIALGPEGVFAGRVTDEGGEPIQGVEVYCVSEHRSFRDYWHAETDEGGRYRLRRINRGAPYRVIAKKDGYTTETRENATVPEHVETVSLNFALKPGLNVSGKVIDGEGSPLSGVRVHWGRRNAYGHRAVTTGDDGRFQFTGLISKHPETVYALRKGYGIASRKVDPRDAGAAGIVTLVLKPELRISGTVVDEEGNPISNARVSVGRTAGGFRSAVTDEQGAFTLRQFAEGEYPITVISPGYVADERNVVKAGTEDARVVLRKAEKVQGRVVDAESGEPVEKFNIRLAFPKSGKRPNGISATLMEEGLEFQDPRGRFEMGSFDPGASYRLIVVAPGYAVGELDGVRPGEPAQVRLEKAQQVTVHVVDKTTGQDVQNADVRFYYHSRREPLRDSSLSYRNLPQLVAVPPFRPQAARDGRYEFSHLGSGTWILEVTAPGHERAVLAFRDGVARGAIRIELQPTEGRGE